MEAAEIGHLADDAAAYVRLDAVGCLQEGGGMEGTTCVFVSTWSNSSRCVPHIHVLEFIILKISNNSRKK